MSVSRGTFLKALGKSIPGMVVGSGAAAAAQKLLSKMAAASGTPIAAEQPAATAPSSSKTAPKIEFIRHGPAEGNRVALTFDDGPTPGVTDRILDELKQRNLHATFFMIGQRIAAAPELARRVLAEGHEIGNHSYTHPDLTKLPEAEIAAEIEKTQEIMRDTLNHCARFFRPPYGVFRRNHGSILQQAGLRAILWTVDTADWSQPGEDEIVRKILADTAPGAIILCHDMHQQTANCTGRILDGLHDRGFVASTLSGLLG